VKEENGIMKIEKRGGRRGMWRDRGGGVWETYVLPFDAIYGEILMQLLFHHCFTMRWQNWITPLLATSSTRVPMSGEPSE
jgi:hypothetical protein